MKLYEFVNMNSEKKSSTNLRQENLNFNLNYDLGEIYKNFFLKSKFFERKTFVMKSKEGDSYPKLFQKYSNDLLCLLNERNSFDKFICVKIILKFLIS